MGHANRLKKELDELAFDDPDAKCLKEVSTDMVNLGKDIQEYLRKAQPPS